MAAALAPVGQFRGAPRLEQHDGLGAQHAVLGGAERQRRDACLPGHFRGRAAQADQRIGEARAIHVQGQPGIAADGADGLDLVQRVDAAGLGGLGDADAGGRHRMHVAGLAVRFMRQLPGVELGGGAIEQRQARAAAVELGRAAFIVGDVAVRMAQHAAPGRRQRRQRQRIGGGAGGHQQHVDLVLEDLGQAAFDPQGDVVGAVGGGLSLIGVQQRGQYLRAGAGGVVTGEAQLWRR